MSKALDILSEVSGIQGAGNLAQQIITAIDQAASPIEMIIANMTGPNPQSVDADQHAVNEALVDLAGRALGHRVWNAAENACVVADHEAAVLRDQAPFQDRELGFEGVEVRLSDRRERAPAHQDHRPGRDMAFD